MQTFLPLPNFEKSFKCLDYKRLGKQRSEAKTIIKSLEIGTGWSNHPAVLMWKGFENALKMYHNLCITEWVSRHYKNNMENFEIEGEIIFPPWFGDERFHASHRSNLLRKNFEFYSRYGWGESVDLPYFWPTKEYCTGISHVDS